MNRSVLNIRLNIVTFSVLHTLFGSSFQTVGPEMEKAFISNPIRIRGTSKFLTRANEAADDEAEMMTGRFSDVNIAGCCCFCHVHHET